MTSFMSSNGRAPFIHTQLDTTTKYIGIGNL